MNRHRVGLWLAIILLVTSGEGLAQQGHREVSETSSLCLQARPLPQCASFLLTQARFLYRLSPHTANPARWYLTADAGWMKNIGKKDGLGLSVFGGPEVGFEEVQYGLRGRYRRWLGEGSSIDVSLGAVFGTAADIGKPGFSGTIDYNLYDVFVASFALEYAVASICGLDYPAVCETEYGGRTYLGVGLGSKLGLGAYGVAGLLGLLAAVFSYN